LALRRIQITGKLLDLILMVDVYHEFSEPVAMMGHIRNALKPNGRVVLVSFEDQRSDSASNKMSVRDVRSELEPLG
jgi:hypothetical protein